jgi:hypothetical protein
MAQHPETKYTPGTIGLCRFAAAFCASWLLGGPSTAAYAAVPPAAGPVTFIGQIIVPAGSPNGATVLAKLPRNFKLMVQTVSFFRANVVAGSIGQMFLQATYGKVVGYYALPEAVADGAVYPAATLTTTFPCGEDTQVIANFYRTGNDTASETENIVMTGYYVAATGS